MQNPMLMLLLALLTAKFRASAYVGCSIRQLWAPRKIVHHLLHHCELLTKVIEGDCHELIKAI